MNKTSARIFLALTLLAVLNGCSKPPTETSSPVIGTASPADKTSTYDSSLLEENLTSESYPVLGSAPATDKSLNYDSSPLLLSESSRNDNLLVNFEIKMGVPARIKYPSSSIPLKFVITPEGVESPDMAFLSSDGSSVITAYRFARIEPRLSDAFKLEDENAFECIELILHDTNEVIFHITPQKTGTFTLSAKINIFEEPGCTGRFQSKTARELKVTVKVDYMEQMKPYLTQLFEDFWAQFLGFWGVLLTAVFAFITLKVKKRLSKK